MMFIAKSHVQDGRGAVAMNEKPTSEKLLSKRSGFGVNRAQIRRRQNFSVRILGRTAIRNHLRFAVGDYTRFAVRDAMTSDR